jgi:hypothetical protein
MLLFYEAVHYSPPFPNTLCCLVYFLVYSAVLAVFYAFIFFWFLYSFVHKHIFLSTFFPLLLHFLITFYPLCLTVFFNLSAFLIS